MADRAGVVEGLLEEHRSLRQESLEAIASRNQFLVWGIATIGLLVPASADLLGLAADPDQPSANGRAAYLLSLLGVPVLAPLVLLPWLGASRRMAQVGRYLKELEERLNAETSSTVFHGEHWLRDERLRLIPLNVLLAGLFVLERSVPLCSRKSSWRGVRTCRRRRRRGSSS